MIFLLLQLFVIVFLMNVVSSLLSIPSCPDVNLKPRKTLKRLRQSFLFVEKPSASLQSSLGIPQRVSRDVPEKVPGSKMCPWTWAHDDNPDRVPRYLTKAVCPSCGHYCRAVLYDYRGLVPRCDVRTGETVWKWIAVEIPVAFVFDS